MVKILPANAGDEGLIPGLGRSSGERNGNPLQYSCLEKSHGQRSVADYSPWGREDSDMTGRLSTKTVTIVIYRNGLINKNVSFCSLIYTDSHQVMLSDS